LSEPRKTRYAGFVIIAVLIFGLLALSSQRGIDTQIEGAIFLSLGALIAWSIVRASRARADAQRSDQRFEQIEGRLGAIEQQLGTRLRKLEESVAQIQAAIASQPLRPSASEPAAGAACTMPVRPQLTWPGG